MNTQTFFNFATNYFGPVRSNAFGIKSITSPDTFGNDFSGRNNVGYFELHDLSIYREYSDKLNLSSSSPIQLSKNCIFYLPPYFATSSSLKTGDATYGCIPLTPQEASQGSTSTPFNLSLAMSCGGHYINTENYLLDFANNSFPKQLDLVYKQDPGAISTLSLNDYFYQDYPVRGRNLLILPCDDGNFLNSAPLSSIIPVFNNVTLTNFVSGSYQYNLNINPPIVSTFADPLPGIYGNGEQSEFDKIRFGLGITPNTPFNTFNLGIDAWKSSNNSKISNNVYLSQDDRLQPVAWYWKYLDKDSTQVVIFDVSNLYYGNQIEPGTLTLSDSSLTGSNGQVSVTIKDNGLGGLYRADSSTPHAVWNDVGNIFYNEGLIFIKNPSLYFLGKDQYEISFKGNRNIHVLKIEATAPRNYVNSSSNPTYKELRANQNQVDADDHFVYITGVNFHDNNLNVIARSKLAQPIIKRDRSKIVFKTKIDF